MVFIGKKPNKMKSKSEKETFALSALELNLEISIRMGNLFGAIKNGPEYFAENIDKLAKDASELLSYYFRFIHLLEDDKEAYGHFKDNSLLVKKDRNILLICSLIYTIKKAQDDNNSGSKEVPEMEKKGSGRNSGETK
jgi:hypothetical protein